MFIGLPHFVFSMPVPCSLEGFDVPGAVGRMLDQPMLWWQALGLFVEHFSDWEASWEQAVGDDALERKRVHALRSASATVGAESLSSVAGELEDLLLKRLAGEDLAIPAGLRNRLRDTYRDVWGVAQRAWRLNPVPHGAPA